MATQIVLELKAKPDRLDDLSAWFRGALPDTRAFDGCIEVRPVRNLDDPSVVVMLELWESRERYQAYLDWRTTRGDMDVLGDMLDGEPRLRFLEVAGL